MASLASEQAPGNVQVGANQEIAHIGWADGSIGT